MELKYLQTFQTIVQEGSFSRAAEKLNYTQSTITFQMGQLEEELSVKLFEKVGRRMRLTKAGEGLRPYVEEVLASVEKLRGFEQDLTQCRGELSVGVAETLLCDRFPPVLKELHRRAPQARLLIRSMNCGDIRDELLGGTLDVGLFYEDVGGFGSKLVTHTVAQYPLALATAPGRTAEQLDFLTPDQQKGFPYVCTAPTCIFRQMFESYLRSRSIQMDYSIELWSIPTIKNLVKNEVGVCFLPRFSLENELKRGELEEIPTGMEKVYATAVCGYRRGKWISPLLQLFLDLTRELEAQ